MIYSLLEVNHCCSLSVIFFILFQWRQNQVLSIISTPNTILSPALSDIVSACQSHVDLMYISFLVIK